MAVACRGCSLTQPVHARELAALSKPLVVVRSAVAVVRTDGAGVDSRNGLSHQLALPAGAAKLLHQPAPRAPPFTVNLTRP